MRISVATARAEPKKKGRIIREESQPVPQSTEDGTNEYAPSVSGLPRGVTDQSADAPPMLAVHVAPFSVRVIGPVQAAGRPGAVNTYPETASDQTAA